MKIGINTLIWSADFTEKQVPLLPRLKAAGFDGIEVAIFNPPAFQAALVEKAAREHGLEVTACTAIPHGSSLVSEDARERQLGLDHMKAAIDGVARAGGAMLAGPFYTPVGYLPGRRRTSAEWSREIEALQTLAPWAAERGVTLAVEPINRFETYFLNTAADAAALMRAVDHPSVGILFDTFHANIEEKRIADGYRAVAPWLTHVHTCENDRGTPGSGHVEWSEVFAALREIGYDGWLTIESFGSNVPEIAAAAAIWRDIESDPESIAFDGIGFLRSSINRGE
jgi:D-psicose/D-tagatose/L-ribulose 3-epimerase